MFECFEPQPCVPRRYPGSYIKNGNNWSHPVPESMDQFMAAAAAAGVTPIVLFEYVDQPPVAIV